MDKTKYLLLLACVALAGCRAHQEYAYVKDAERGVAMPIENTYSPTIQANDQLYIYVYSETPETVVPFNEETNKGAKTPLIKGYLVSQEGDIIFPILGNVHVAGLTLDELQRDLERRLIQGSYVSDPVVSISLMNFGVTVIGEVQVPRYLHTDGTRLTIFEAIAMCGDVTMDGIRSCVTIVRTDGVQQIVDTVDLTSKEILNSPFYYLHQNDIVFVEPTKKRKRQAYRDEDWPKYLTTGASAVRLAWTLIYRFKYNKIIKEVLYGK